MLKSTERQHRWTSQEILDFLRENHQTLYNMGARKIGLFGSYRRDTPKPDSDIDILVMLARPSFDDYMDIKIFLQDHFGCKVDLVIEDDLKEALRDQILSEVVYVEGF